MLSNNNIATWDFVITKSISTPTSTPTATATPTPTPPPKANMKFHEVEPYQIKEIPGPLESTDNIILIKKDWTFKNEGSTSEKMRIDIDELDADGNIIKNVTLQQTTETVPPGGPYKTTNHLNNNYNFSRRYEIGETLYLAISIWGKDTETKPSPPYMEQVAIRII